MFTSEKESKVNKKESGAGPGISEHLHDFTNYPRTMRMIWEVRPSGRNWPV